MRDVRRLVVVVAVVLAAARLDAQRGGGYAPLDPARVGPHLGYNFDAQALDLGLQATLPLTPQVELYPTFDYYAVSPASLWALNLDLKIRPRTPRRSRPRRPTADAPGSTVRLSRGRYRRRCPAPRAFSGPNGHGSACARADKEDVT